MRSISSRCWCLCAAAGAGSPFSARGWSLALTCLSAGMALQPAGALAMAPGAGFNDLLAATARLQAVYALLLALGLVL